MTNIVPESWDIPCEIRDRFGDSAGRQRAMSADGHLLLVLHAPPGLNARERTARLLWRDPRGNWLWNVDGSISNLLRRHIGDFQQRLDLLEKQLQKASCAEEYFNLLQAVVPLLRTSRHLHSTLQQAREAVHADHDLITARDSAADVERAFELLQIDAQFGLDYTTASRSELQSRSSHEMAASAHRLNIIAALFFPITAISSVFGMNISTGLESYGGQWLFWTVIGVAFLAGAILARLVLEPNSALPTATSPRRTETGSKQTKSGYPIKQRSPI